MSRGTNRSLIDLEKRFKQECDDLLVSLDYNPGLEQGLKEHEEARSALHTEYASRRELPREKINHENNVPLLPLPPRLSTQEGPKQERWHEEEESELSTFAKRFSDMWVTRFPLNKPMSVYEVGSQEIEKKV